MKIKEFVKSTFVVGMAAILPLVLTVYVIEILISLTNGLLSYLPENFQKSGYVFPGLGLIFAVVVIFLVGIFARNTMGKILVASFSKIVEKIPFVAMLYKTGRQVSDSFFKADEAGFKQVVLIEWPRKDLWTIAFVTSTTEGKVKNALSSLSNKNMLNLYVPTTPNPTSGFYIMAAEDQVISVQMTVEEAFKTVISSGKIQVND